MKPESGYAAVNGTRLYFECTGSGTPVVFMHGFSLDRRMWDDQVDVFAKEFRVVRYDLRGFGKSDVPTEESYSHVDDLHALLQHLHIPRAHLVGLSLGGRVAIDYTIAHPRGVLSLVPVDSVLDGFAWTNFESGKAWEVASSGGIEAARDVWLGITLFKPAQRNPDVAKRLHAIVGEYSGWHWLNTDNWKPLSPRGIDQLSVISAPTLAVVGEEDIEDFHSITGILESRIAGARAHVIPHAGHMSNMEQPASFNSVVLEFLRKGRRTT